MSSAAMRMPAVDRVRIIGDRERAARRRVTRQIVGCLLLTTILGILHVWSRITALNLRYALTTLERRVEQLGKQIEQTEGEVAAQKSIERLMRVAADRLDLAPPRQDQVVFVQSE